MSAFYQLGYADGYRGLIDCTSNLAYLAGYFTGAADAARQSLKK